MSTAEGSSSLTSLPFCPKLHVDYGFVAKPPRPAGRRPEPSKPEVKRGDLAEVERALSVLGGHHPEHERALRETNEARAKKRASDERAAKEARKKRL